MGWSLRKYILTYWYVFADKVCSLEYAPPMPMEMAGVPGAEQSMNMSPMDLFDSIFWGRIYFLH